MLYNHPKFYCTSQVTYAVNKICLLSVEGECCSLIVLIMQFPVNCLFFSVNNFGLSPGCECKSLSTVGSCGFATTDGLRNGG